VEGNRKRRKDEEKRSVHCGFPWIGLLSTRNVDQGSFPDYRLCALEQSLYKNDD
jgi:hypothetical protein